MFEKLKALEDKFNEINEKLMQPETVNNTSLYTSLMKEYKTLTPIVEKFGEYKKAKAANDEAIELLDAGGMDKDFKEMVQMQLEESKEDMAKLEEELKLLLLPKDPNDERNVIIEIRGGAGGEEAALFAGSLYRMYSMYAASKGWTIEVMNANETELGGYKEITFSVSGEGAYSRLKYESGVHRVQRVPETESQGRVHTSTVTVAVLPEADEVELDLNEEKDLKIDVFRSSGAGGQHINKTSSAIRITHMPTGIVVTCQNERSQFQNKDKAMQMLKAKLYMLKLQEQADKLSDIRGEVTEIGWGNQIRSYVMQPYTMVKDHRTNAETGNVDAVMDGGIDLFINAYLKWIALGTGAKEEEA